MKNPSKSKTTIIVIVVVVLAAVGYFYYEGSAENSAVATDLVASSDATQGVGSTELSLLNQVRSLNIDPSLFQDPAYQTLQDYSVPIPEENVGRPNPFAPLPGEAVTTGTTGAAGTSGTGSLAAPAAH